MKLLSNNFLSLKKKKLKEPQKASGNQVEKPLHNQENNKQNPKETYTRERNELKYI